MKTILCGHLSPWKPFTFVILYGWLCSHQTRVRSLHWLPLSLTDWLTNSCLVDLIDVTMACEDANSKLVEVVTVADVHAGKRVDDSLMQIWYYQSRTQPSGPLCLWQCLCFNCLHHLLIWWALCNHRLLQGKHPLCAVHPSRLCKARWMHFVTLHGIAAKNMRNPERPIFFMSGSSHFFILPKKMLNLYVQLAFMQQSYSRQTVRQE